VASALGERAMSGGGWRVALDLLELGEQGSAVSEAGDGGALSLQSKAAIALAVGPNPVVGDEFGPDGTHLERLYSSSFTRAAKQGRSISEVARTFNLHPATIYRIRDHQAPDFKLAS